MLRRDNDRKDESVDNKLIDEQDEVVKKAYTDVVTLRKKIEELKAQTEKLSNPVKTEESSRAVSDALDQKNTLSGSQSESFETQARKQVNAADVEAAERAVREQARQDIADTRADWKQALEKDADIKMAKEKAIEAQKKFAQKKREAEEKKRKLEEAERIEAEMKRQRKRAEIQAEISIAATTKKEENKAKKKQAKEKKLRDVERELERRKKASLAKDRKLQALQRKEQEREARRLAAIDKKKEAAKQKSEKQKKNEERERLIAEQRNLLKQERIKQKQAAKLRQQQRDARRAEDKRIRKAQIKQERAEKNQLRRQRRIAKKSAEMGGGIVNVHGTVVQTEILPVSSFSLRDLFGKTKKKEIVKAQTEEEKQKLLEESKKIQAEARATAASLVEMRRKKRANHPLILKGKRFLDFCDRKKKPLLVMLSIVLLLAVGTSALFNNFTTYEYSYAGQSLGFVKNKDDVLQITGMVQSALTEEKKVNIEIDPRQDITFKRVYTFNKDIAIDTPDDVLKRLTYMGDVNVKAYGIYVDGQKVGAVRSKEIAAEALKDVISRYTSKKSGTEVKKVETLENVKVKRSNTPLGEMLSEKAMAEKLCTDSVKETVHTVERGETIESIATYHKMSVGQILKDNEDISADSVDVGSTILLKETAPLLTVRVTEVRTFEEKIDYDTVKKKDKDLYEGYTEIDKKGEKGISDLKDKTVSINGEVVETKHLENNVKKEPVTKVVRVGTKERPPTVGSGTYIWPAHDGTYTVTSEFKWRWGRQHQGIDMGCSTGNDVLASDGGTVIHAGYMGGYGNLVIIDHQNGIETYYAHNSALIVSVGDKVFQGQHIAEAGNTGNSFGSHIHFGVKDHGTFENPRNYLPKK